MILDLGCGGNKYPGAVGIDISSDSEADYVLDMGWNRFPFQDGVFDSARCFHAIEHVPFWVYSGDRLYRPIVHFLSEVYRVLKPGGKFYILTLAFPDPRCFEDPDHKAVWTTGTIRHFVGGRDSDIGNANDERVGLHVPFQVLRSGLNSDKLLEIVLQK